MTNNQIPSVLRWQEPPAPLKRIGKKSGRWDYVVNTLKLTPGKWALILEGASFSTANNGGSSLRKAGCKTSMRGVRKADKMDLYAMFPLPEDGETND